MTEMILRFQAQARPSSYDPETMTFSVILATNAPIDRGSYIEVLDLDAFGVSGWPESIPLQTDHSNSVRDTVGRLSNFRMETLDDGTKALIADGKLSSRSDNEAIAANLKDGAQTGFSIGFTVSRWSEKKDPLTGKKIRKAIAGRLVEGSFVVNPADPRSNIRSNTMPPETLENPAQLADNNSAVLSEIQLRSLGSNAGVPKDVIDAVVVSDANDSEKMQMMLATVSNKPKARSASSHNDNSLDNPIVLRRAAIDAFDALNRNEALEGSAAAVFADGEVAFARRLLRNAGEDPAGLSDSIVLRNAAATSDYAIIAGGTFNLSMRREFENTASPVTQLFGRSTVTGFNPENSGLVDWTTLAIGDKLENGHYQSSYVDESGETITVHTIGGVTSVSRELSINAGARLGNMGQKFGKRLSADIADRSVSFLEQNNHAGPKMADGNPVFYANRENIETFTQTEADLIKQLMDFRSKMARRKGKGDVLIGTYPTHWTVHPNYEETALRILAAITPSSIADVNPLAGKLEVVIEPRLNDPEKSWLTAEPSKMDGAVRVFLQGNEAPHTDSRNGFETDTIDFKIRHDFGLGWLEWRSWSRLDHTAGA